MIRRVRIRGYKSLRDVDLELAPLTVIFGPNAAGKSNLHDALALMSRLATTKTLSDAFDPKVHRGTSWEAFSYGPGGLEELLRAEPSELTIEVDVELSQPVIALVETRIRQLQEGLTNVRSRNHVTEHSLRYRVTVEIVPPTGVLRVRDEYLVPLRRDGAPSGSRPAFIEYNEEDGRLRLRMEGQAHPTYHEVGLDYTLVSSQLYPPHYPHITALREEMSRWHFYYLEPDMMRRDAPVQDVGVLEHDGGKLAAFYFTLKSQEPKKFEGISKALRLLLPLAQDLNVSLGPGGLAELSIMASGTRFSSRLISEGTLRVLGLLAITRPRQMASVIGYEEPENGVHPRRQRLIAELFANARQAGTQYLINTHSPLIVEGLQATPEVAFISCYQDEAGGAQFKRVEQQPLFYKSIADRILEGEYGG